MADTVVGVFDRFAEAQHAVNRLVEEGFDRDEISILRRGSAEEHAEEPPNSAAGGAATGAVAGAALGGLGGVALGLGLLAIPGLGPIAAAGPIVAGLSGAGAGAAAGGVLGAIIGLGVKREEAEAYAEAVHRGGTLVALKTASRERAELAADVMRAAGAIDIRGRTEEWRQAGWTGYHPADEREPAAARAAHQAVMEREAVERSRAEAREKVRPFEDYEDLFRKDFEITVGNLGYTFEHHLPAYRYGYLLATESRYGDKDWDEFEPQARAYWEERNPNTWDQFRHAIRYAWQTVSGRR